MKITMYELLGMIKDGKAPKKIKYDGMIWEFEEDNLYYSDNVWLDDYCNISQILNDKVEILEEEKKIPEKSNIDFNTKLPVSGCSENEAFMMTCISHLGKTIDSLIDYLKSKGE